MSHKKEEFAPSVLINHIIFVLDRSGSMGRVRQATLDSLNEQIQQMKLDAPSDQANFVTVLTFAKSIVVLRSAELLSEIKTIEFNEYQPYGNTALFDGIGRGICLAENGMEQYKTFNNAALLFILTDGNENASDEFVTREEIRSLIEDKKADGRFTFTFMGCSEEILKDAVNNLGFKGASTMIFGNNPEGLHTVSINNSAGTRAYFAARSEGKTALNDFYGQPDPKVIIETNE